MKKIINIILGISFIFYLSQLVDLLFLNLRGNWSEITWIVYFNHSSNFVPFKTISTYIMAIFDRSMNMDIPIKNLVGNIILFLPMGIYLPFFIRKVNKIKPFAISIVVMTLSVEVVQLVTRRGSFDIDDFILNFLGALIGFGIWKTTIIQKLLKTHKSSIEENEHPQKKYQI